MKRLRLGIVGAGHLGRIHARLATARDDATVVAVADPFAAAREAIADELAVATCADHRDLLGQVDAVVIAAPTSLHRAVGLDFLSRGVHALIEKPLAPTVEAAGELVEAARRSGTVLQVGHVERFNPVLAAAGELAQRPKYIEAVRAGGFTGRSTDVGAVLDLMIHDLDLALALTGSAVVRVQALGLAILGQHEDVAQARLEFADGCVANLSASRVSPTARRSMQVWSERGWAQLDFAARTASLVRPGAAVAKRQIDAARLEPDERAALAGRLFSELLPLVQPPVPASNALADEQQDFIESIRTGRAPRVDGEQGLAAVALAARVLQAIREHRFDGLDGEDRVPAIAAGIAPTILRGPHWPRVPTARPPHREAG